MPINIQVLQALAEGPTSLIDLRREAGSPPQTTMRGHLRTLAETGVVNRRRQNDFPGSLDFELTEAGRELLVVAQTLGAWLQSAPQGPLLLGSSASKSAVRALVEGWSTSIVRALAARPLSLTELNGLINCLSYPSLERRLAAMRLAGQIERLPGRGRGTPYAVTSWLRCATAPLTAAARWERAHAAVETAPIKRLDAEAAFLLAMPLLRITADVSGSCRLGVETGNGDDQRLAGVMVEVENGAVVSCVSRLEGKPSAWAVGSSTAWLAAVIEHDLDRLELGGERELPRALLAGMHGALFRNAT